MKEEPSTNGPQKASAKTGLTLFALVGGFLLLIMIIGWIMISARS